MNGEDHISALGYAAPSDFYMFKTPSRFSAEQRTFTSSLPKMDSRMLALLW